MIIEINDTTRTGEISDLFTEAFPFLSILFFRQPHATGQPSAMDQSIDKDVAVGSIESWRGKGSIEIHAWQETGMVEQVFAQVFGLYIQVFRREGTAWIQTAGTDGRTLEEQHEAGQNAGQELMDGTDQLFNEENPA